MSPSRGKLLPPHSTMSRMLSKVASYASAITQLSSTSLSLKRSLNRLEYAENELNAHLARANLEERLITRFVVVVWLSIPLMTCS